MVLLYTAIADETACRQVDVTYPQKWLMTGDFLTCLVIRPGAGMYYVVEECILETTIGKSCKVVTGRDAWGDAHI